PPRRPSRRAGTPRASPRRSRTAARSGTPAPARAARATSGLRDPSSWRRELSPLRARRIVAPAPAPPLSDPPWNRRAAHTEKRPESRVRFWGFVHWVPPPPGAYRRHQGSLGHARFRMLLRTVARTRAARTIPHVIGEVTRPSGRLTCSGAP